MRAFLETERLLLRNGSPADADDLFALNSDPQVMRYLTSEPATRASIRDEVLRRFMAHDGREPRCWIAVEKASNTFIGGFALETAEDRPPTEGELGYRLRASAWGRGYATEGARALIAKGFADLGLERIWAQTMAVNTASRRVMERAGLSYVRTFHLAWEHPLAGTEQGEVEYALTRETGWCRPRLIVLLTGTAGSMMILNRSQTNRMASRISASVAVTIASTWWRITTNGAGRRARSAGRRRRSSGRSRARSRPRRATGGRRRPPAGSAPMTRVEGERPLTARAVPASRPPPPTGETTRSSGPAWSSSSQAAVAWPAMTCQSSNGWTSA